MSSENEPAITKSVSLEELIALNDEIVSLSRAGVPLELGLKEVSEDQPGALGEISRILSERMQRGESLSDALAAEGDRFPHVYRRVVEAGLRVGRLPAALEAISNFGWEIVDLRQKIGMALLYPSIVIAMAYGLFLVFIVEVAVRIRDMYEFIDAPIGFASRVVSRAGESVIYWGWIPPLVLALLILWWRQTSGAQILNPTGGGRLLRWIPGVGRISADHRSANFSDLLALMVDQDVPLPEAITLAAEATADRAFVSSAREFAEAELRGDSSASAISPRSAIPPFLRWLISRSQQQQSLVKGLRLASDMYRRRANNQTAWLRIMFPILTGVVLGGGATLFYALALFAPLIELLSNMSFDVTQYK